MGYASFDKSFADYIDKISSSDFVKEAVSGTTLVNQGEDSYIEKLENIDNELNFDIFVCQL